MNKSVPALLILFGAFAWGVCSAASAATGLYVRNRLETDHTADIVHAFFRRRFFRLGAGADSAPLSPCLNIRAIAFCGGLSRHPFFHARRCGSAVRIRYRVFYAQWHAPALSRIWFFQQLFTSLGAVYQFAILGLGLYFPFAVVPVLAAGAILCRPAQRAS